MLTLKERMCIRASKVTKTMKGTMYVTTEAHGNVEVGDWDQLCETLEDVFSHGTEYAVLSAESDGEDYLQVSAWNRGMIFRDSFLMELSRSTPDGQIHFRLKTKDTSAIIDAFQAYSEGSDPVSQSWDDVTDEFTDS